MAPEKIIDLEFTKVYLEENIAISTIAEGVILDEKKLNQIFEVFTLYYQNQPFVSIANRVNDYTIDPNLLSTKKHPGLIALAVVTYKQTSKEVATFEREFYDGVFEIFDSLEQAKNWAKIFIKNYNKKAGL